MMANLPVEISFATAFKSVKRSTPGINGILVSMPKVTPYLFYQGSVSNIGKCNCTNVQPNASNLVQISIFPPVEYRIKMAKLSPRCGSLLPLIMESQETVEAFHGPHVPSRNDPVNTYNNARILTYCSLFFLSFSSSSSQQ